MLKRMYSRWIEEDPLFLVMQKLETEEYFFRCLSTSEQGRMSICNDFDLVRVCILLLPSMCRTPVWSLDVGM